MLCPILIGWCDTQCRALFSLGDMKINRNYCILASFHLPSALNSVFKNPSYSHGSVQFSSVQLLTVGQVKSLVASWVMAAFSSVQSLRRVRLFVTPWTAARQASLSITISQSLLKLTSIESVMPSNHLIPFSSHLQSFPSSGSFPMSQFFTSGGQSIGVSALISVLPMNIQDWFPLG